MLVQKRNNKWHNKCKSKFRRCVIGTPLPWSSPNPCNVTGVSRGRIPITVYLMHLREFGPPWTRSTRAVWIFQNPRVLVAPRGFEFGVRNGVVSPYVSEPKRLRPSFGHGVDWRTGVDVQHAGSFTHSAKLLSCPWGRDPWGTRNISFVSRPYSFPQHCMPYGSPLEQGCYLIFFKIGNKNT